LLDATGDARLTSPSAKVGGHQASAMQGGPP